MINFNSKINRQGQVQKICIPNRRDVVVAKPKTNIQTNDVTKINRIDEHSIKVANYGSAADVGCSPAPMQTKSETSVTNIDHAGELSNITSTVTRLSPRLEMRLALNNDIMGDEDLISFDPGPTNLSAILRHDLSSYHRFTGRDLISRSASRIVPKEAHISFSQQKNSKMDTPIPNRKKTIQNTWNSSAYVVASMLYFIALQSSFCSY